MKDIIYYNYNIDIDNINEYKNYSYFFYNGYDYYFTFFNRTKEELDDILVISNELKNKSIKVHDIILNKDNSPLTIVGNVYYILLKINSKYDEEIFIEDIINYSKKLILTNKKSKMYRNDWGELWSKKIDYFEYQIKELGKDKKTILDSFSYYIGLAENAISYVNRTNNVYKKSDYDIITLSHRRIFVPNITLNYLNPLSFIFDLSVRDIAEYLKSLFFNNGNSLFELKSYLKINRLTIYSYHMLYGRLLYPSYYFDLYEDIMNNNSNNERIINVIDKVNDYEIYLKDAYLEISKYCKLEEVEWIMKKESN